MSEERYINAAQQRVLRILVLLAGNEVLGLTPSELADAVRTTRSNITRDLSNLREAGLADRIEDTGRWCITPLMGQLALRVLASLEKARQRLDEITQRYTTQR